MTFYKHDKLSAPEINIDRTLHPHVNNLSENYQLTGYKAWSFQQDIVFTVPSYLVPRPRMNSAASFATLLALIPLAAAQSGAWGQCTPSVHNVPSCVYVYTFKGGGIGWTGPTVCSWRIPWTFLSH